MSGPADSNPNRIEPEGDHLQGGSGPKKPDRVFDIVRNTSVKATKRLIRGQDPVQHVEQNLSNGTFTPEGALGTRHKVLGHKVRGPSRKGMRQIWLTVCTYGHFR